MVFFHWSLFLEEMIYKNLLLRIVFAFPISQKF